MDNKLIILVWFSFYLQTDSFSKAWNYAQVLKHCIEINLLSILSIVHAKWPMPR